MTCRHGAGDPSCSSNRPFDPPTPAPKTPDADNYEIMEMARFGSNVVLKVKYPNCSSCAYEGNKVMVFLGVSEVDIVKWRKIDPHFRLGVKHPTGKVAPSPAARFPASTEGWADACNYAKLKGQNTVTTIR